jgi:hypothetical protein
MTVASTRAQWPHTIDDITNSLDGIWGLVGATSTNGNLLRLERSLHEPLAYTITEYRGNDESDVVRRETYDGKERDAAIKLFAQAIGFEVG